MQTWIVRLLSVVLLLLLVAGCAGATPTPEPATEAPSATEPPSEPTATTAEEPQASAATETPAEAMEEPTATPVEETSSETDGAGGTLRLGVDVDPVSLDPHHYKAGGVDLTVIDFVTDGLVAFDREMNIVPELATEWEWEDNTTLRFTLREGVTFHDGTPWNAEAAKFNLDRMAEAAEVESYFGRLTGTEVVDEYTVVLTLSEPYAPFLRNLASPVGGMVSPAAAEELGQDLARQVVGSGPFVLQEWTPREQIVLSRNADYWATPPRLETVIVRPLPEESTRMLAFEAGELDAIMSPSPTQVQAIEDAEGTRIERTVRLRNLWLGIINGDPMMEDAQLRRAIAHAIDREALVEFVAEGLVDQADALIPPSMMEADGQAYPYDPDRAQELLAESGYDGSAIQLWAPEGRYFKGREIAEAIQEQLSAVGINTELEIWEWGAYNQEILEHTQQLWIQGWGFVTGDPEAMRALFHTEGPFNSFNLADEQIDQLFDEGVTAVDPEERAAVYGEMQTRLIEDLATVVPIYYLVEFYAVRDNVQDFYLHPLGLIDLSETTVTE